MRKRVIAALVGAVVLVLPLAAGAADLDYERGAQSPYDDPRYADMYADPTPPPPAYAPPRYTEPHSAYPPAYPPSYKDQGYLAPMQPPRYAQAPRYDRSPPYDRECLPRTEIHARLRAEGWRDFHDIDVRGQTAYVKAQRPSGDLYDLEVDRCSGGIVTAKRLGGYPGRPYAWREPPRYRGY